MKNDDLINISSEVDFGQKIFKWEDVCKNCVCLQNAPGIINSALLEEVMQKEFGKHETGRMLLETVIPPENIQELRIEFHRILRIDHLWMYTNLKILKLNNNYIEKIENIDCLVHLIELDLSFNKIAKIENLDSLVNLEILTFFANLITCIENMQNMKKLTIFSIGRNCLSSLQNVIYLRRLPNLKSLNMADNPCALTENFRYYVAKFLPNLIYYEYKRIATIERDIGDEIFHDHFQMMLSQERQEMGVKEMKEKEEEDAKMHVECFVEFLNTRRLFESLFEYDPEGRAFLLIGEKAQELYITYEENILRISMNIFDMGQAQYEIREKERKSYNSGVEVIQKKSQAEAIVYMEKFLQQQSELFAAVKTLGNQHLPRKQESVSAIHTKIKESHEIYEKMLNKFWKVLMELEITLNEQMLEVNETYEQFLTDAINNFNEEARDSFANIRISVVEYHDQMQVVADNYYTMIKEAEAENKEEELEMYEKYDDDDSETEKDTTVSRWRNTSRVAIAQKKWMAMLEMLNQVIPVALQPYIKDKDTLTNALATSKDIHLLLVDNREDLLMSRARDWLQNAVETLGKTEIIRNREKVLEISNFLQRQREEWEELWPVSDNIFRESLASSSNKTGRANICLAEQIRQYLILSNEYFNRPDNIAALKVRITKEINKITPEVIQNVVKK